MTSAPPLSAVRRAFAKQVGGAAGVSFAPVVEAFAAVPRERFLGPGPWEIVSEGVTPDDDPRRVYRDALVVLDKAKNLNNGEPRFWAAMFDQLRPARGERVIHAGAGSGYYTALLAEMVGPSGRVEGIEYEPHLARAARANLAPWPWASAVHGDALALAREPADAVVASAGLDAVPLAWVALLKQGGRLLFPLTRDWPGMEGIGAGGMLLIAREGDSYPARFVGPVGIYHCMGARSAEATARVEEAFARSRMEAAGPGLPQIGSLRLDGEPDQTCWLRGQGWWLSTLP